jgi:transposase
MKTIQYVAMDVHQASISAVVRRSDGTIGMRATLETSARAALEFVGGLSGRVWATFEEGTQSQWLHDVLIGHVEKVVVCDPRANRRDGNKSDRIDADWLSEQLRLGGLTAVYHGSPEVLTLKELVRNYRNVVEDSVRVMQRLKALFRAKAIRVKGAAVYNPKRRQEWLALLTERGARMRAETLYAQLDLLNEVRPKVKRAMVAEARKKSGWKTLLGIPFFGPVRVAQILAIVATPHRFRGKRQLWPYAGLAVVTRTSADYEQTDGKLARRRRPPMTRGLNRNHNPVLKDVFKGAAQAAIGRPGPLRDYYEERVRGGVDPDLAKLTLARKIAALTLRLWKRGESYDPTKLSVQAT